MNRVHALKILSALMAGAYLTLGLFGCSKEVKKKGPIETIFVQGDPMNMVAGASFDSSFPFPISDLSKMPLYQLSNLIRVTEKARVNTRQNRDLESENAPHRGDVNQTEKIPFQMVKNNEDGWSFKSQNLSLEFGKNELGELVLQEFSSGSVSMPIEGLHYSITPDQNTMSLLARIESPNSGSILLAFYWERQGDSSPFDMGSKVFEYFWGAGVKIPWDSSKTLEAKICGSDANQYSDLISEGIQDWDHVLASRLKVQVSVVDEYPPFTDLNTHCIHVVDNYLLEYDKRITNPGLTLLIKDRIQKKIIDGEIFFFKKELEKYRHSIRTPKMMGEFMRIVRHEFGHFLGLGHQFDGTASVMSYKSKYDLIYTYDRKAIRELYPVLSQP